MDQNEPNMLLENARNAAKDYVSNIEMDNVIGIVFLGAISRGYFDKYADIDISIFLNDCEKAQIETIKYNGFDLQTFKLDYNEEISNNWSMSKRWAYSTSVVYFERDKILSELLSKKVSLLPSERKSLMLSGITLSEWYCNRLLDLWIFRDDILNAHSMINEGINQYCNALFALNNQLVADTKWRIHYLKMLPRKPESFEEKLHELFLMKENSIADLERRRNVFMELWRWTLLEIENYVDMKYEDFRDTV